MARKVSSQLTRYTDLRESRRFRANSEKPSLLNCRRGSVFGPLDKMAPLCAGINAPDAPGGGVKGIRIVLKANPVNTSAGA